MYEFYFPVGQYDPEVETGGFEVVNGIPYVRFVKRQVFRVDHFGEELRFRARLARF
ncbi:hypothetical protein D3C86_2192640 [compost metagenome]